MFTVNRHLWARWDIEDGEVRFHCRYYKERPGKVEETGKLIVKTMKEFIEGLRLKGEPKSHVGWPAENSMDWHYIPYLLGIADCPDTP